jgi:hypothetical protein
MLLLLLLNSIDNVVIATTITPFVRVFFSLFFSELLFVRFPEIATAHQTERLQQFTKNFHKQLETIEDALEESLSDVWDLTVDPISLDLAPYEQTHILRLVSTDNKIFNKVILVFASLCQEMQSLRDTVCD